MPCCWPVWLLPAPSRQISQSCAVRKTLKLVEAVDTTCQYQDTAQAALTSTFQGCSQADVIRVQMVGLQVRRPGIMRR